MVRLPESSNCKIQFLVDRKFPDLDRKRASLVNLGSSVGNFTELQSRADQYRRDLLGKSVLVQRRTVPLLTPIARAASSTL